MRAGNTIAPVRGNGDPAGFLEGVVLLDLLDRYE